MFVIEVTLQTTMCYNDTANCDLSYRSNAANCDVCYRSDTANCMCVIRVTLRTMCVAKVTHQTMMCFIK